MSVDGIEMIESEARVYEFAFAYAAGLVSPLTIESAMEIGARQHRKTAASDACTRPLASAVHAVRVWRWAHGEKR